MGNVEEKLAEFRNALPTQRIARYTENALRLMLEDGDAPFTAREIRKELRGRARLQDEYDRGHGGRCYCMECM